MQLEEPELEEKGQLLAQLGDVEVEVAKRVLRKHKGDMERAADAILEGDRGETSVWESQHRTTPDPKHSDGQSTAIVPHPSASVIDLTGDGEEEMSRAIQMSLQDDESVTGTGTQFRRTDRAPHPEWQMVRSNVMCRSLYEIRLFMRIGNFRPLSRVLRLLLKIEFWTMPYKQVFRISTKKPPMRSHHLQL